MKISIVTISYNQDQFIEETINSVLNQRGVELEYIVVDPGSKDNSRKIIEKYKDRINKIIFEPDLGPGDGLNKGFSYANGDICFYLNSDDILLPGSLAKVADLFNRYTDVDVISGHGYLIDDKSIVKHSLFSNHLKNKLFIKKRFCAGYSIVVQPSTFFKSSIFKKVGGFDNEYKIMWDAAFTMDMLVKGAKFKVVDEYFSGFRVYPESITGSGTHTNNKGKLVLQNLQMRILSKRVPNWQIPILRISGWLLEPQLLFKRLVDQIKYPKRVL